ncbi:tyrosine-type recombinase/integrase [Bacillus carboniphilus]|uniref:Tyrosine-type recombinase/integrase n=1 Tax=Bacillus carboniphilus TaxID=86663 RepID=A0ABN0VNW0_9BACI
MKGHIRKRGNKYAIVVDMGRDNNGKRKQKWFSGYDKKKDAERDLPIILNDINQGTFVEPANETYMSYLEKWIKNKKSQIKPTTLDTYQRLLRVHIIPGLGHLKLGKMNRLHIKEFYSYLEEEKELAPASIKKIHTVIRSSLSDALEDGLIAKNISAGIKTPRIGRSEIKVWDEVQLMNFLNAIKAETLYIAFHLPAMTGMRRSEVLGIRWKDIDFENKILRVVTTITTKGKSDGKTQNSYSRPIDLDDGTIAELKNRKKQVAKDKLKAGTAYDDQDLVVCTSLGKPISPRNLNRLWYKLRDKVDIPNIRFHDLRHTHATLMLLQGIPAKVVSERLGHASIQTTLNTYGHLLPSIQKEAIQIFSRNLIEKSNNFISIHEG